LPITTNDSREPPDVSTFDRLWNCLRYPVRTPKRSVLTALVLVAVGFSAWYAVRVLRFTRARAAAEQALAAYDYPMARERLGECVRLRPRDPAVRLQAAQAARRDGDYVEADAQLARYRELVGPTPEGRLEEALVSTQQGRVEENVEYLIALADSRHPAAEQILEALAVGCVHVYHLDRAGFWVGQLLTHFPKNPVGRLIRAQLHATLGRRDQGLEECQRLVADFPHFARARLYLAGALTAAQRYDDAVSHYEELLRARPGDMAALLGLARCLQRTGRADEASPLIRELEERHADKSEATLECGRFALKEDRLADAERLLRRAVQLAPNDHEAHYHLGVCLDRLGRRDESRVHIERFKQIEADLARLEQFTAAAVKNPRDPAPRREAGMICLRNGQIEEGLRWLSGARELAPNDPATHDALEEYFKLHGTPVSQHVAGAWPGQLLPAPGQPQALQPPR